MCYALCAILPDNMKRMKSASTETDAESSGAPSSSSSTDDHDDRLEAGDSSAADVPPTAAAMAPPRPDRQALLEDTRDIDEREVSDAVAKKMAAGLPAAVAMAPPRPSRQALLEETRDLDEAEVLDAVAKKAASRLPRASEPEPPRPARQIVLDAMRGDGEREDADAAAKRAAAAGRRPGGELPGAMRSEGSAFEESAGDTSGYGARAGVDVAADDAVGNGGSDGERSTAADMEDVALLGTLGSEVYSRSDARVRLAAPLLGSVPVTPTSYDSQGRPVVEVPEAYLVESTMQRPRRESSLSWMWGSTSNSGTAVMAEIVPPWYRRPKIVSAIICVIMAFIGLVLALLLVKKGGDTDISTEMPSAIPSLMPSTWPTFDPSPTIEIVRSNGELKCGLESAGVSSDGFKHGNYTRDLCRAVASVVLGNPNLIREVDVTAKDRFIKLRDREIDLLVYGDIVTIERFLLEPSAGVGFSFSVPYFYSGVVYVGEQEYVECAENRVRFGSVCSDVKICVEEEMDLANPEVMRSRFPNSFLIKGLDLSDAMHMLRAGDCNVIVSDLFRIFSSPLYDEVESGRFVLGNTTLTNDPLGMVTRLGDSDSNWKGDHEWSTIVDAVREVLFYAWSQGFSYNETLCTADSQNLPDIPLAKASACVGNIGDILTKIFPPSLQKKTDATYGDTYGLIWTPNFGSRKIQCSACDARDKGTLAKTIKRGFLNCGVINKFEYEGLAKMGEIYCRSIAAAIFQGDYEAVNITRIDSFEESKKDFVDGAFDVIAGGTRFYDLTGREDYSTLGLHLGDEAFAFSIPYYWAPFSYYWEPTPDSEVPIPISIVTQQEPEGRFPSFVDAVVYSTIFAALEGRESEQMPLNHLFGEELRFMFKDIISYSGDYNAIYHRSFGVPNEGVNQVNRDQSRRRSYNMLCRESGRCNQTSIRV